MIHGLALCAGAAGLELGVELALGSEYRTVGYVERSPFVAGILAARMLDGDLAKAPIWDDLTTFDGGPWRGRVDLVSAGFPCQPFSQAGLELTTSDPRYLWDDVARVIGEAGPRIVFLENVPRLLTARFVPGDDSTRGGVFGRVLADLAALGYVGAWRTLRAADVGAPHRRERVFILAVAPDAVDWSRDKHGRSKRTNGQTATWHRTDGERGSLANPDRERRQGQWLAELLDEQGARGDQPHGRGRRRQRGPVDASPWTAEPDVGRVVDGVAAGLDLARASRRSRLRATGNGCVPHQAAAAFISLAEALR